MAGFNNGDYLRATGADKCEGVSKVNTRLDLLPQQTHVGDPAATGDDLDDQTGGTASGSHQLVDITGSDTVDLADVEANFATIAAEYNKLKDDVEAINAAVDAILSRLETLGLFASS